MGKEEKTPAPPKMNPYIFTILLLGFGLWCMYDGWFTTDPEMLEHSTFNKVIALILLPWSVYDFFKVRKWQKKSKESDDK